MTGDSKGAFLSDEFWKLGVFHEEAKEYDAAIDAYEGAAVLKNLDAIINLANILDDYAIPKNPQRAVKLYKVAVKMGYDVAAYNLAIHYRNVGFRRWYIYWLRVAAEMNNSDALKEIRNL